MPSPHSPQEIALLVRAYRAQIVAFNSAWKGLTRPMFKQATEYHDRRGVDVPVLNTYIVKQFLSQFGEGVWLWDGNTTRRCEFNAHLWDADVFCAVLRPNLPRVFRRCSFEGIINAY